MDQCVYYSHCYFVRMPCNTSSFEIRPSSPAIHHLTRTGPPSPTVAACTNVSISGNGLLCIILVSSWAKSLPCHSSSAIETEPRGKKSRTSYTFLYTGSLSLSLVLWEKVKKNVCVFASKTAIVYLIFTHYSVCLCRLWACLLVVLVVVVVVYKLFTHLFMLTAHRSIFAHRGPLAGKEFMNLANSSWSFYFVNRGSVWV